MDGEKIINGRIKKICIIRIIRRKKLLFLQHDTLHPVASTTSVAQKCICLCTNILQHQSAEARILLAYTCGVCIVLFDIEFHLLLQRFKGC